MNEAIVQRVGMLAKMLGTSKKAVLENAIRLYAEKVESDMRIDVLEHTSGCWNRDEDAAETIRLIKKVMRHSQGR